ncbi:MAG: hypothetical protein JSU96_00900 [Acidobacteriota bacterium]|nr:MAG: hypothetical protein JSU96_00900 [Acidobacteriota bacterium]
MDRYRRFNRSRQKVKSLNEREHLLDLTSLISRTEAMASQPDLRYQGLARRILEARSRQAPVILMMGAHLLRAGTARLLIELMERGWITHICMNGAGPIHDFEMALIGATTESVARYIAEGQFGLWRETGQINDIVKAGHEAGLGYGESIGREIEKASFPNREISVLAAGYRLRIPVTVHIGIGYDIIHEHPNFHAASMAGASDDDFLIFVETVSRLEGGVLLNFGSSVMGPEVYLKALAMARNTAHQEGREIRRFTTAVFDLVGIGEEWDSEPSKDDPRYYFRPFKTILVRTVRDGGESLYFQGDHRKTFPTLFKAIIETSSGGGN